MATPKQPKRKADQKHSFIVPGTFQSLYAAEEWCIENGYSFASLCGNMPIGLLHGDHYMAKWKNLTQEQVNKLDGVMISPGGWREGEVQVIIYEKQNS